MARPALIFLGVPTGEAERRQGRRAVPWAASLYLYLTRSGCSVCLGHPGALRGAFDPVHLAERMMQLVLVEESGKPPVVDCVNYVFRDLHRTQMLASKGKPPVN